MVDTTGSITIRAGDNSTFPSPVSIEPGSSARTPMVVLRTIDGTPVGSSGAGGANLPTADATAATKLDAIHTALTASTLSTSDVNNTGFIGASTITSGTAFTAGRSIGFICTTSGTITVVFQDTSTLTVNVTADPSFQTLPFVATNVTVNSPTVFAALVCLR